MCYGFRDSVRMHAFSAKLTLDLLLLLPLVMMMAVATTEVVSFAFRQSIEGHLSRLDLTRLDLTRLDDQAIDRLLAFFGVFSTLSERVKQVELAWSQLGVR